MDKKFKFRYANEIAGGFVLTAVVLCLLGIVSAGRYQGWFEGKFSLKAIFVNSDGSPSKEGSFGLQEGNEVKIMNTKAGRVGKIMPISGGRMQATFIIQNRFKPFVSKDSVAMVQKIFELAGDAFVEIKPGKGATVGDGDVIECRKDEEMMVSAKNMLKKFENDILPMTEDVKQTLKHINGIAGSIEKGSGLAGTVVKDDEFAGDVRKMVKNMNALSSEAQSTLVETRKLVEGMQKHWMFRKYVEKTKEAELLVPMISGGAGMGPFADQFSSALNTARTADDAHNIARFAYNLAVCRLYERKLDESNLLLHEARSGFETSGESPAHTYLLEAELERRLGNTDNAMKLAEKTIALAAKPLDPRLVLTARILLANLFCDLKKPDDAVKQLETAKSLIKKTESTVVQSMLLGVWGRIYLLEDKPAEAAKSFEAEAALLKEDRLYYNMALALINAGASLEKSGDGSSSADHYFRAGRSLLCGGYAGEAETALTEARRIAKQAGNSDLLRQIDGLPVKTGVSGPVQN